MTWHASRVKTWNDMLTIPFTVGGEGTGSDPDIFSAVVRNVFGVKLKLVSGYPGTAEVALAIERGEVDGRCGWSWSSLKLTKPDWIAGKRVNLRAQLALKKSPELPDVPLIFDFATTERQRQILKLMLSRQSMARPFAAPPGPARGSQGGAAHGVRRDDGRCRIPGRGQAARARGQSGERRGHRPARRASSTRRRRISSRELRAIISEGAR